MEQDKEFCEPQMKIVDAQIDGLVYGVYGLTQEEIGVVKDEWNDNIGRLDQYS